MKNRIIKALEDSESELWFPHLTYDLAQAGWRRLEEITKLDALNYGTLRLILNNADVGRDIVYTLLIKNQNDEVKDMILVELLPESIANHYKESGVNFYTQKNFLAVRHARNEILDSLSSAFNFIRLIPSLFETVVHLVKCIHLIKPESDEYDISFSEPHIPFSIFVSVPQKNNLINTLRVAEAIVHEAMHLQLTLIESHTQLVTNSDKKFYSPWKSEYRTAGGILHALYVFRVLQSFFLRLSSYYLFSSRSERDYLNERRILISEQINEIRDFSKSSALNENGKTFTKRLLLYEPL